MKFIEVNARTILHKIKGYDKWFGVEYTANIYRGCNFQCIYCDSRSQCYGIENFNDIQVKINAAEVLYQELKKKRRRGTIALGAMSDAYNCANQKYQLTRECLKVIDNSGFPLHLRTKSSKIVRDIDILKRINRNGLTTAFSITTGDDRLSRIIEPGASVSSERFRSMKELSDHGIYTGTVMMPLLPFIEDNYHNVESIIIQTKENGGQFVMPWLGVTLRDIQREFFYDKLDIHFPEIKIKYQKAYGNQYDCFSLYNRELMQYIIELCQKNNLKCMPHEIKKFSQEYEQYSLFTK